MNHLVVVVAIVYKMDPRDNHEKLCFVTQNSWGTSHGEGGYEYVLIEDGPGYAGIFTYRLRVI